MDRYQTNKVAKVIRAKLGAERISQKELAKRTGIRWEYLNGFLCRRMNLIDEDIEKLMDELELNKFWDKLSAPL